MARASGKVILLGEHAVVYGVPAIAAGIERGAEARASAAHEASLVIAGRTVRADDEMDLARAFRALLAVLGAGAVRVEARSDLPLGAGLGSSAAIAVAVARAVCEHANLDEALVPEAALAFERIFHGNPSGIDTAAAQLGGCLWYTREGGAQPIRLARSLELVVAIAGPSASTKSMVEAVARQREQRPEVFQKSLAGVEALVKNARLALEAGDLRALGRLFDLNQMLLSGLLVSNEAIENACAVARSAGALGAKLTGAGGGGAVIALCEAGPEPVLEAFRAADLECFATRVEARRP